MHYSFVLSDHNQAGMGIFHKLLPTHKYSIETSFHSARSPKVHNVDSLPTTATKLKMAIQCPAKIQKWWPFQKVSSALYVFNFIAEELTAGRKPGSPPTKISQDTLNRAKCFVDYTETHKEIAMETGELQFSAVQYLASPVFSTTFLT